MLIADRLRALREQKHMSQGDIEKRTGLIRYYTSRVENGHTVPSIETLEKYARALEVPMYQLFYEGEKPPKLRRFPKSSAGNGSLWGESGKEERMLTQFCRHLSRMSENDRKLLLQMAQGMARRGRRRAEF